MLTIRNPSENPYLPPLKLFGSDQLRRLNVCHGNDSEVVEDVLKGIRDYGGCTEFGVKSKTYSDISYISFRAIQLHLKETKLYSISCPQSPTSALKYIQL